MSESNSQATAGGQAPGLNQRTCVLPFCDYQAFSDPAFCYYHAKVTDGVIETSDAMKVSWTR